MKYEEWQDFPKEIESVSSDPDIDFGEWKDFDTDEMRLSPEPTKIPELNLSEGDNYTEEEIKEMLPDIIEVDPDAILSILDFIPKSLHDADWLSPQVKTYIPEKIDMVDPISLGITYKEAGDFLRDINPVQRLLGPTAEMLGYDPNARSNKEISAFLSSWGHGMQDVGRGVKQLLDIDVEQEKYNQAVMNELYSSEELDTTARLGQVGGFLTEPIGFLIPGAKAKTPLKALMYGVGAGTALGTVSYVDEESGLTRAQQAATGAILGGAFTYSIARTAKAIDGRKIKKANRLITQVEEEFAQLITEGHTMGSAARFLREVYPETMKELKAARELTQNIPHFVRTADEAKDLLRYKTGGHKTASLRTTDKVFGILHTRVKEISEETASALRDFEYSLHTRPLKYKKTSKSFKKLYKGMSKDSQKKVQKALLNGDFDVARREILRSGGDEGLAIFDDTINIFDELGKELKARGVIDEQIANYWHRHVKDPKGLLEALGSPKAKVKYVAEEFADKNKHLLKKRGYAMTPHEEGVFLQGLLKGDKQLFLIRGAKERGIHNVQDWMLKYYSDPIESLDYYIHNAIFDAEQARFFGPKAIKKAISEDHFFDPQEAIEEWAKGRKDLLDLSKTELRELKGMLRARFGSGQQSMSKYLRAFKVFTYSTLLGNPLAAAVQSGDAAVAAYKNGLKRSTAAMIETITGQTKIKVKDLGLVDNLVQEFSDLGKGQKVLDFVLRTSGFKTMDRFGKSVLINSALRKAVKAASNIDSKEYKYLSGKYRKGWAREWTDLISDLKKFGESGKSEDITDNIRFLVWNELSDTQPISLSEIPQKYLEMNNGRILYMLRTFMLKQIDVLRQDVVREAQKGNTAAAIKNAARYLMIVGGANLGVDTLKDVALGRETDIEGYEDVPGELVASFFKTFGISDYIRDQAKREGVSRSVVESILVPPVNVLDDIFINSWGGQNLLSEGELGKAAPHKAARYIPYVGPWVYEENKP